MLKTAVDASLVSRGGRRSEKVRERERERVIGVTMVTKR
jgi:hypothetical protein